MTKAIYLKRILFDLKLYNFPLLNLFEITDYRANLKNMYQIIVVYITV